MNTMKRIVAVVLAVCMVGMLAVSATAAPIAPAADGSYTYSFVDAMSLERSNGKDISTYGAQSAPIPESNNAAQEMWNNYYEEGILNWSYPQVPGTGGSADKTSSSVVCNSAGVSGNYTAFQFKDGALLFKATTVENTAWMILKIKAPAVGTYDVSITHNTANNSGARHTKVQIIPAFDLPDADNYDAAAHNANIDAIVAAGTGMLSGTLDCDMNKTATGEVTDMGSITLTDVNADEYFVIFSMDLSKSDGTNGVRAYLQSLTLTPAEEVAASAGNYAMTNATGITLANGAVAEMASQYDAGSRDVKIVGLHSGVTNGTFGSGMFNFGYTMYSAKDPKWVALQVRIPADGTYNVAVNSGTVNGTTDPRTGTPMGAYLVKASEVTGTDYAALITASNKIGSASYGTGNPRGDYGVHALEEGEYILVLQAEASDPLKWSGEGALHANNFYLISLEFNPKAAAINDVMYDTVAAAAEAAQDGDVVKLLKDYVGDIDLPAGVALDLNGNDWTVSEYIATNASEYVTDSVGTGKFVAGNLDLFADNAGKLPLLKDGAYTMNQYALNVGGNDYEASPSNPAATRFWFQLTLADAAAYDLIASGNSGLTIGVELDWGAAEGLAVTFDNGEGAEAFAADWAAAAKNNANIWLYVDIVGVDGLTSDLTVKPVLNVNGQSDLWTGCLIYDVA